jgi:hypothetical protein
LHIDTLRWLRFFFSDTAYHIFTSCRHCFTAIYDISTSALALCHFLHEFSPRRCISAYSRRRRRHGMTPLDIVIARLHMLKRQMARRKRAQR